MEPTEKPLRRSLIYDNCSTERERERANGRRAAMVVLNLLGFFSSLVRTVPPATLAPPDASGRNIRLYRESITGVRGVASDSSDRPHCKLAWISESHYRAPAKSYTFTVHIIGRCRVGKVSRPAFSELTGSLGLQEIKFGLEREKITAMAMG